MGVVYLTKRHNRFVRFLWGFGLVLALCAASFTLLAASLPNRGATQDEIARTLPGDGIVSHPILVWNHAVTLAVSPEQVWPWLIQMGDSRGAFYSYTFIQNLMSGQRLYVNADSIYPEWQTPQPWQGMVLDYLVLEDYRANSYLLAAATPKAMGFQWTLVFHLTPLDATHTRLLVRHRIAFPQSLNQKAWLEHLATLTGYVMEKGMFDGLRRRVEGQPLPPYQEGLEIFLWLAMLGAGITAAVLFVPRSNWRIPLSLGLAALGCLFLFTYMQPAIWLRGLLDGLLLALVILAAANKI